MADQQNNGLTDIATCRAAIEAKKMKQFCFITANIDGAIANGKNVQYWYVQYKCAFLNKIISLLQRVKKLKKQGGAELGQAQPKLKPS